MKNLPAPLQVIAQALSDWWDAWVSLLMVNLALVLSWLTVVLGPPATLGMYHVAHRLVHGEDLGLAGFIEGGRRYFVKSWLWALLNLGATIIVGVNFLFYGQFDSSWAALSQGFFVTLGAAWWVVQFYALPYLMEQERKHLKLALRNGLFTALAAPGYTAVLVSLVALMLWLGVQLIFPLFLGLPCWIAVLGTRAVRERLETFDIQ